MASISELFGLRVRATTDNQHKWNDLMGIELELEDVQMLGNSEQLYDHWSPHADNSLRNGSEFVTSRPVYGDELQQAINAFYSTDMNYTKGPRTSTHIHINMTNSSTEVLQSMFVLMYTLEGALYSVVEESRKWGGYAMPLCEMGTTRIRNLLAPASNTQMVNAIAPSRNQERYYGFNTNVKRHGTVEFRYFPGGPSKEELESWLDFVSLIKKAATKYSVTQLIGMIYDEHSLRRFLTEELDYWGTKLLGAVDATTMYQSFSDVASMASDSDNRELPSGLVFITPAFLGYIITKVLKKDEQATKYIKTAVDRQNIMAKNEWNHYLSSARSLMRNSKLKPPQLEEDYNEEPYPYDEDEDEVRPGRMIVDELEPARGSWDDVPAPTQAPALYSTDPIRIAESYASLVAQARLERETATAQVRRSSRITTTPAPVRPQPILWEEYTDLFNETSNSLSATNARGNR